MKWLLLRCVSWWVLWTAPLWRQIDPFFVFNLYRCSALMSCPVPQLCMDYQVFLPSARLVLIFVGVLDVATDVLPFIHRNLVEMDCSFSSFCWYLLIYITLIVAANFQFVNLMYKLKLYRLNCFNLLKLVRWI